MCPSKTWPTWNPRNPAESSGPGAIHGTPGERRALKPPVGGRGLAMVLLSTLVLALLLAVCPVQADTSVHVTSCELGYRFSQWLDFALEAESDSPIVEVVLFFGRVNTRLVRRIYPEFVPGTHVRVQHREELVSGQFAPGTLIHTWWQLRTQDGASLRTEPQTFEYTDTNQDWNTLSGQRVDLYWYGEDAAVAEKLLARSEETITRLQEEIGVSVEQRVRVYAYNNRPDMSAALSRRSEGYDDRVMTLGVAVDERTLILLGTHRDAHLIVAHELSHVLVGMATDNPFTGLPRWLDEGLAMYAEGELPPGNRRALEEAIRADELLSVRSMTSYSGQASQVDLFYGEVYSLIEFMLREYGRDKMHELLAAFAEGARQEEALQQVYGFGLAELDDRWRASLGLGGRQREDTDAPAPATEQQPERDASPICSYSLTAGLFPLTGAVFWLCTRKEES